MRSRLKAGLQPPNRLKAEFQRPKPRRTTTRTSIFTRELPDSAKPVSTVLVCTRDPRSQTLPLANSINNGKEAQAAVPVKEISDLFEKIVGNIEIVLLVFAVMIVLVAGIGIMVSIYNSMNDRRHEIAIMRALVHGGAP